MNIDQDSLSFTMFSGTDDDKPGAPGVCWLKIEGFTCTREAHIYAHRFFHAGEIMFYDDPPALGSD